GLVVGVQPTIGALRLNCHLHVLGLDGVYAEDEHGELRFQRAELWRSNSAQAFTATGSSSWRCLRASSHTGLGRQPSVTFGWNARIVKPRSVEPFSARHSVEAFVSETGLARRSERSIAPCVAAGFHPPALLSVSSGPSWTRAAS